MHRIFRDLCSLDKENLTEIDRDGRAVQIQAEVLLHGQQSAEPSILVETDMTVRNRETMESFLDTVRGTVLQYMNDPCMLAAAVAVFKRKLEKVTTAKQAADMFFQGATLKRFKTGAAIRVQPTSIARRRLGLSRGTKKMPVGRLAKVKLDTAAARSSQAICRRSRPHCLAENICKNVPNAKKVMIRCD